MSSNTSFLTLVFMTIAQVADLYRGHHPTCRIRRGNNMYCSILLVTTGITDIVYIQHDHCHICRIGIRYILLLIAHFNYSSIFKNGNLVSIAIVEVRQLLHGHHQVFKVIKLLHFYLIYISMGYFTNGQTEKVKN